MTSRGPGRLAVGRVKFFSQHGGEVNFSAFSPNGQILLTASDDGCVYGWETHSSRLEGHTGFSPDGHLCASMSCDCTIRFWDVERAKCLRVLKGHQRSVETVSFSPDSRQLASGSWDKQVMLWEVQSGQMLQLLAGHRDSVQSSDFSPRGDCLATGSWDSTVRIWELRARTPVIFQQELKGHRGNISCLCYSVSGLLASGSWDKTVHIWKPTTSSLLVQLKGHSTWVRSIAFSPQELWLASAGYSHVVKVWNCSTGKCLQTAKVRPGLQPRGWERLGSRHPQPRTSAVLCPHVCLHLRREAAGVWGCRPRRTQGPRLLWALAGLWDVPALHMAQPLPPASQGHTGRGAVVSHARQYP